MQHQVFITLLSKKFTGEITPDESEILNDWLKESTDHQRIAEEYRQVWDKVEMPDTTAVPDLDVDLALFKVMAKINNSDAANKPLQVSFKKWRSLAATLTLLLVSTLAYVYVINTSPTMVKVAALGVDKQEVHLPDGSKVWLKKGSEIVYPETFEQNRRCVELKGEAFFEVTHNPAARFCISTPAKETIEVLGTSFCVQENSTQTKVIVKTGKVRFETNDKTANTTITAGNQALHKAGSANIELSKVANFNALAWQTGHLEFMDVPVKQVIEELEAHFNVKIQLTNPNLLNCKYTSTRVPNDLTEAIRTFCGAYNLDFSSNASGFILKGGTCL